MHESLVPHSAYCGAEMQKNANQHQWPFQDSVRVCGMLSVCTEQFDVAPGKAM